MKTFLLTHKKLLISVSIVVLFLALILVFIKYKIGDIRPFLSPSNGKLVEQIEKQKVGENVAIPLTFPTDYQIGVFAKDIKTARDIEFSEQGTLVVSTLNEGKVYALSDKDNDGKADESKVILANLDLPHGLAFHEGKLFVAELTQVDRYKWDEQTLTATKEKKILDLPTSNGHQTRTLAIKEDGTMFVTIGSTCNVCFEKHDFLASVIVSDVDGNNPKVWADGLRNSAFIKLNPASGELWGTENSRDMLGDNIPTDEINIIRQNQNYGWPVCYGNKIYDSEFDKSGEHATHCSPTIAPAFEIQAHSAPLGLAFINSSQFPSTWQGDLLVSYHGSWNRSTPTGYKIVHLKVEGDKILSQEDFMTGFLDSSQALGRPVDLAFDSRGSLFISDDKAGAVYKLSKK